MQDQTKYFVYTRKSSENEDRQILSIEGQLAELQRLIEREKLIIIDTYIESGSAHKPNNRPKFTEMLQRINKGEARGIICWHLNRLSRNPLESGSLQWMLQQNIISSILTPHRQYKSEDNALLFSIETSEANQYSRDLSVNVKRGLKQKIEMGWPPGSAPLGYLNTKSSIRGSNTVIPDPDRWHIIRKGFDLLIGGANTVPKILSILNNEYGLRTRPGRTQGNKPISRSSLYRIFTDPFYYGYFYRSGILYKGAYSSMITIEEFDRVQEILGRKGRPRPKRHLFAFTGLIKCGLCGASITACRKTKRLKGTGEVKSYSFYHCTKRKKNPCSASCYIPESTMEDMIQEELQRYDIKPSYKDWAIAILNENHIEESQKQLTELESLQKEELKTQEEIDTLLELRISGEIDAELYQEKKHDKQQRLIRLQQKEEQLKSSFFNWRIEIEDKLEFVTNIVSRFNNGDIQQKKEICHRFGWNWVLNDKKLFIYKQQWLMPIKKYKDGVEDVFGRLEPEKNFKNKGRNNSLSMLRPLVRALVDEVGTNAHRIFGQPIDPNFHSSQLAA